MEALLWSRELNLSRAAAAPYKIIFTYKLLSGGGMLAVAGPGDELLQPMLGTPALRP